MTGWDWSALRFGVPAYLWLLVVPGTLFGVWVWQLWRRFAEARLVARRQRSQRGRARAGDLLFWLCLLLATSSAIMALARPKAIAGAVRSAGIDLVILQDGSASMHVTDVGVLPTRSGSSAKPLPRGNRWQRSMAFLRQMGESLRWDDDRIALALFAHIAAPQVRLTRDPNTFFFFLDHLEDAPPFRLEDDASWDTNIERGIYWGMRLVEKDEELSGRSPKPKAFVLVSDGQAWSGEVARSVELARARRIPIHVVGVGTTAGGAIPDPARGSARPVTSSLDRSSLAVVATAAGGRYFELGTEPDRDIASTIIDLTRRSAVNGEIQERAEDLYWPCLLAAALFVGLGFLLLRERSQVVLALAAAGVCLLVLQSLR